MFRVTCAFQRVDNRKKRKFRFFQIILRKSSSKKSLLFITDDTDRKRQKRNIFFKEMRNKNKAHLRTAYCRRIST